MKKIIFEPRGHPFHTDFMRTVHGSWWHLVVNPDCSWKTLQRRTVALGLS